MVHSPFQMAEEENRERKWRREDEAETLKQAHRLQGKNHQHQLSQKAKRENQSPTGPYKPPLRDFSGEEVFTLPEYASPESGQGFVPQETSMDLPQMSENLETMKNAAKATGVAAATMAPFLIGGAGGAALAGRGAMQAIRSAGGGWIPQFAGGVAGDIIGGAAGAQLGAEAMESSGMLEDFGFEAPPKEDFFSWLDVAAAPLGIMAGVGSLDDVLDATKATKAGPAAHSRQPYSLKVGKEPDPYTVGDVNPLLKEHLDAGGKLSDFYNAKDLTLKPKGVKAGAPDLLNPDGSLNRELFDPLYHYGEKAVTPGARKVALDKDRSSVVVPSKDEGLGVEQSRLDAMPRAKEQEIVGKANKDRALPATTKNVRVNVDGHVYEGEGGANGLINVNESLIQQTGRGLLSRAYQKAVQATPGWHRISQFMRDPEEVLQSRGIDVDDLFRSVVDETNESKYWYEQFGYILREIGFDDAGDALKALLSQGVGSQKASPQTQLQRFFSWWPSIVRGENWPVKDPTYGKYGPGLDATKAPLRNVRYGEDLGSPKTATYFWNKAFSGWFEKKYPAMAQMFKGSRPPTIDTWIFRYLSDDDAMIKKMHGQNDYYTAASNFVVSLTEEFNKFLPKADRVNHHQVQSMLWHPIRQRLEKQKKSLNEPTFVEFFDAAGRWAKARWGAGAVKTITVGGEEITIPKAEILENPDWQMFAAAINKDAQVRTVGPTKRDMWGGDTFGSFKDWLTSPSANIEAVMRDDASMVAKVNKFYKDLMDIDPKEAAEFAEEADALQRKVLRKLFVKQKGQKHSWADSLVRAMFADRKGKPFLMVDESYGTFENLLSPNMRISFNPRFFRSVKEMEEAALAISAAMNQKATAWNVSAAGGKAFEDIIGTNWSYPVITLQNFDLTGNRQNRQLLEAIDKLVGPHGDIIDARHGDAGVAIKFYSADENFQQSDEFLDEVRKKMDNIQQLLERNGIRTSVNVQIGRGDYYEGEGAYADVLGDLTRPGASVRHPEHETQYLPKGVGSGGPGENYKKVRPLASKGFRTGRPEPEDQAILDALGSVAGTSALRGGDPNAVRRLLVKGNKIVWEELNEQLRQMITERAGNVGMSPDKYLLMLLGVGAGSSVFNLDDGQQGPFALQ